jgi:hypothetical protein
MSIINMQTYRDKKTPTVPELNWKIFDAAVNVAVLQFRLTAMALTTTLFILDTMSEYLGAFKPKGCEPE